MELNYYQLLKVSPTAPTAEIKRAYIKASKEHHPDTAGADAAAMFNAVTNAKNILIDPIARQGYDAELARENAGTNQTRATREPPRQERSEPFNPYANPRSAEEKAAYDRGTREYWQAHPPTATSAKSRKPKRPKGEQWWWPKSPSLLVFTLVGILAWHGVLGSSARAMGAYLIYGSLICARFLPNARTKKFWLWSRRKAKRVLSRIVGSHKTSPSKVDASK